MVQANTPVILGSWSELGSLALPLRIEVFVHEQGVPQELEQDEYDADALHAIIMRDGVALATGRLLVNDDARGKIGRLAVHRDFRGRGLGRAVLLALEDAARQRGVTKLALHAQCNAQPFYAREGFIVLGAPFEEAGIEHVLMVKAL